MGSTGASLSSPPSHSGLSNIGAALQLWESACATFSNPKALLSFTRNFQILDQDGTVNRGKVVFLTTCIMTMAGCGFLSSLLRRRGSKRTSARKRVRRGINDESKSSTGTTTSSEEEDYDSSGSLHHGTDAALPQQKVTHKHHEQSADGLFLTHPYGNVPC
jgi:hypothetical protein